MQAHEAIAGTADLPPRPPQPGGDTQQGGLAPPPSRPGEGALAAVGRIAVACLALRQVDAGIRSGPILFAGLSVIFLLTMRAGP